MKSGNVKSIVMKSVGCLRLLCLIGLTATTVLNAEIPPYFSILADNYVLQGETWRPGTMSDCGWSPSREDEAAGFACGLVDVELAPKMDWIWPETAPRRIFRFIGLRGEIRAQSFMVRTLRDVSGLSVSVTDLTGPNGTCISAENIDVRRSKHRIYQKDHGEVQEGHLLRKADTVDLPGELSVWHWLSVYVPEDAAPGVYTGKLLLAANSDKAVQEMTISLCVLPWDFPGYPEGYWGAWMPGHFHGESRGTCHNYAAEWWTPERIDSFFRFFKSRGFNTPIYSEVFNEYWVEDGVVWGDFSVINQFVAAQRRTGVDAAMLLDVRSVECFAHAVNRWIVEHYDGIPPKGFLGVTTRTGRHCAQTGVPYNDKDSEYFTKAVLLLKENAEKQNWPFYLIYPEEEIDNRPEKRAGYDHFMPVLRKIVGDEHCIVVDNSMGYPWSDLDRGWRDKLPNRNYDLWVEKALEHAREDNAKVWTYNRGWRRTSWGFYLQRIGAVGSSQWAEAWDGGSYGEWYNAIPTADGKVLTSMSYERAALGLRDLAILRKTASLINELRVAGRTDEADAFKKRLDEVSAFYPLDVFCWGVGKYQESVKDVELEARRYQTLLILDEVLRALGQTGFIGRENASGAPALVAAEMPEVRHSEADRSDRTLFADGVPSANFQWNGKSETYQRSVAVSEQQFHELYQASPVNVAVHAWEGGLELIFAERRQRNPEVNVNHSVAEEDGYRFVIEPQGEESVYDFAVDALGRMTCSKDGNSIPMQSTFPWKSAAQGGRQRVVVPWAVFGRNAIPVLERWRFNAARFYKYRSLVSTWTPVSDKLVCTCGYIVFASEKNLADSVNLGNVYPGHNIIHGKTRQGGATVTLKAPDGRNWSAVSGEDGTFSMEYDAEDENSQWQLEAGRENMRFAVRACGKVLEARLPEISVISGDRAQIRVDYFIGNAEHDFIVGGVAVSEDGRCVELKPLSVPNTSYTNIYLDTSGLTAGKWKVRLSLKGSEVMASGCLDILPAVM